MTSTIAKVTGKTYLCIRNRHITLLVTQMDTTKAHKTSCRTWRLVFISPLGYHSTVWCSTDS